jgi:hypothetical protein
MVSNVGCRQQLDPLDQQKSMNVKAFKTTQLKD